MSLVFGKGVALLVKRGRKRGRKRMLPILRVLKWGRVFRGVQTAGVVGSSASNVSRGYFGIQDLIRGRRYGGGGREGQFLNPHQRYDITVMVEGAEVDVKQNYSAYRLFNVLNAMNEVPNMQLLIAQSDGRRGFLGRKKRAYKDSGDNDGRRQSEQRVPNRETV